jgi:hypothetical protein
VKWETKDKLQKTAFIIMIIAMVVLVMWGYENCQRSAVNKILYQSQDTLIEGVCNKTSCCMPEK